MGSRPKINRLAYLLLTLLGSVLIIFGPLQTLEASYRGFLVSYLFGLCSLSAVWCLWFGLSGLAFGSPSASSYRYVFLLTIPVALVMPNISRDYHVRDEPVAWDRVIASRDAELWQNRYVGRVPETFRREGWRSEYALAVCHYCLTKDDTGTLPWYAEQVFHAHPELYDERAREAVAQTWRTFVERILRADEPAESWRQAVLYLAERPSRAIVWVGKPPRALERRLKQHYRDLLTFRDQARARPDDVRWTLDGERCLLRLGSEALPVFTVDQLGLK